MPFNNLRGYPRCAAHVHRDDVSECAGRWKESRALRLLGANINEGVCIVVEYLIISPIHNPFTLILLFVFTKYPLCNYMPSPMSPLRSLFSISFYHWSPVLAAPAFNLINSSTNSSASTPFVGYVSDPNGRGTISLLLSCLLTLLLCVWSALHLNVPEQNQTKWQWAMANARWIVAGIYAPELVVFTAWRQWGSARILGRKVHEYRAQDDQKAKDNAAAIPSSVHDLSLPKFESEADSTLPLSETKRSITSRRYTWTKTHSFFASTGGFAIDIDESYIEGTESSQTAFLPSDCPRRLTLTARGIALLAACGRLPDIPQADILDKSKADGLAKAVVVIQACWMLLQVLGRVIARLPVTLLEVNTVAHV
jgi:hypothetical protein